MQTIKILSKPIQSVCKTIYRYNQLQYSPNSKLSKEIWNRYKKLPAANCRVQVTYLWIDGTGENILSKTKTLEFPPVSPKDCPNWVCNGSVINLADRSSPDIILCPVAVYNNPIIQGNSKLVLCETYTQDGKPTKTNHRQICMSNLNSSCNSEPVFGFEQMFQCMDLNTIFGWPLISRDTASCKPYYCSVGADQIFGRDIIECTYKACLHCGVNLEAAHPEIEPSQWEFHFGATAGIKAGDDVWVARYLLQRIAEDFGIVISFKSKESCMHNPSKISASFSTKEMREEGGIKCIEEAIKKLEKTHAQHMEIYAGPGAKAGPFTSSVGGDRNVSCRIPKSVAQEKKGHFLDKRPPANADPYKIMNALITTLCLAK